jgi:hypothetical protein
MNRLGARALGNLEDLVGQQVRLATRRRTEIVALVRLFIPGGSAGDTWVAAAIDEDACQFPGSTRSKS